MLMPRASVVVRAFTTAVLATIVGALLVVVPSASAVEAPDASVFAIQTNGPNGLVTLGDWYTSNVAGAGGGYHYIRFTVPCGWPGGLPVYVDLFSPEMNRVSGALAQSEEPNGTYDSTQFELYGPGATVGPGYASPAAGTGIAGTRTTYQPGGVGVAEAWVRYATLAAPVTCGNYVVRTEVLTADPLNPAGTGDDQNGWRIRVGTDSDPDPTNAPPANYDNPDGLIGTNDEVTLGLDQASFQQDSGALACQTFFEYVSPGQASIVFHNFDMDGNTRVRYYAPSDATYDPTASSGGVPGSLSTNGQWNGGTLATRVGDTIPTPESGWWRFVTCISNQNQFIQEGEAGRAAYYVQPPTPALTIAKSDGLADVAPGQTITYTIDVNNVATGATAGAANNVVVHDLLPAGVTFLGCGSPVPAQGTWGCSHSSGDVTFTQNGWIEAGDAAQLTVTARVNQGTSGSIVNTATADYTDQIGNPFAQVSASDTDTIVPSADLAITKTDGVASVTAGTSTTYSITLTNNGPTDEPAGVVITDTIPAGVTPSESEPDCALAAGVFTCTTAAVLASGDSVMYQLTLAVPASYALATLSNTAAITSWPVPDPDASNDSATDIDTVTISADLSIAKTDSADPVDPGDSFTYTLTVTNNGPSDASGLTVSDTVPAGFTITSVTSGAGVCGFAGQVATCTRASLPAGSTWVITISVDVDLLIPGGLYTDTATVSATSPDPVPGNDSDSEGTLVTPVGDLAVTKTDGVATVVPGTSTTYTITLANLGPTTVPAGAVVSDSIPANTVGSESEGDCAIAASVFSCTTSAPLASGASVSYQLTLAIDAGYPGATLVNTASVTSSTIPDPFPVNDSASDTDAIAGSADLAVTKSDGVASVVAGTSTTYTISVTNNGPSTVPAGVIVSDPIPAGTTGSESEPGCAIPAGVFTCTTSSPIVSGGSASYQLTLTLSPGYAFPTLANTASIVSSPFPDPNPGNDSAGDVDTVTTSADLSVVKTDAPDPVPVGAPLTYSLAVTNAGPSDATSVSVVDTLPAGVTFGSATPSQGSCAGAVTCSLGSIVAGATATITIVVTPTATGVISNTATVSSSTPDPVPGNNADTEPTTVVVSADLSVTKTDGVAAVDARRRRPSTRSRVTNNGPSDVPAGIVRHRRQIPAGTVAYGDRSGLQRDGGDVHVHDDGRRWPPGASVVYHLTLAIDAAYPSGRRS